MTRSKKKKGPPPAETGRTISYWLKGQWVTRRVGVNNNAATVLQIAAWQLTALVNHLLRPVKNFIEVGFEIEVKGTNLYPYNAAFAENYFKALRGKYPDVEIDYPNAVFSKGSMPVNEETTVSLVDRGIRFSWDAQLNLRGMHPNDRVMMVAYSPEKRYAFYDPDGARRSEGTDLLPLVKYPEPVLIHTYVAFLSANKKRISTTLYTGQFLW
jgi:hypothetical protein